MVGLLEICRFVGPSHIDNKTQKPNKLLPMTTDRPSRGTSFGTSSLTK